MLDRLTDSDLFVIGTQEETRSKLKRAIPDLRYGELVCITDPENHWIIDDLTCFPKSSEYEIDAVNVLRQCVNGHVSIYAIKPLVTKMTELLADDLNNPESQTVIVLAGGKGARIMYACLSPEITMHYPVVNIQVAREENLETGTTSRAIVNASTLETLANYTVRSDKPTRFFVLDDVIGTGRTVRAIKEYYMRKGYNHSTWYVGSSLMYSPYSYPGGSDLLENAQTFDRITSSLILHGIHALPKFNRLSSLVSGKDEQLMDKFLAQYLLLEQESRFLNAYRTLQRFLDIVNDSTSSITQYGHPHSPISSQLPTEGMVFFSNNI